MFNNLSCGTIIDAFAEWQGRRLAKGSAPAKIYKYRSFFVYLTAHKTTLDRNFSYQAYFPGDPAAAIQTEAEERRYASGRYTKALYDASDRAALADAVADLAFAQIQRCKVVVPPYTDEYEQLSTFVCSVYAEAAVAINHLPASEEAVIQKRALENYFELLSARTVRRHLDKSWPGKYAPRTTFYPLG